MQEKIRVYALAKELNLDSKDLIDLCKQAGIDVKNQLSSLDPQQRDVVVQLVKHGSGAGGGSGAAPAKSATPVIPQVMSPVPVLHQARAPRREPEPLKPAAQKLPAKPAAPTTPEVPPTEVPEAPSKAPDVEPIAPAPQAPAAKVPEIPPESGGGRPPDATTKTPASLGGSKMRDLSQPRPEGTSRPRAARVLRPQAVVRVAKLPPLKQRPLKDEKKAQEPIAQKPLMKLTPEMIKGPGVKAEDLINRNIKTDLTVPPVELEDDDDAKGKVRPGQVTGRDKRHQQRNERAKQRKDRIEADVLGARAMLPTVEEDRPQRAKRLHKVKKHLAPTQPRKGRVPVDLPITVRSLSEAIGIKTGDLLLRLQGHGVTNVNINSTLESDLAETIALETGCDLEIKRPLDAEDQMLAAMRKVDDPSELVLRAPVVTIMGHVDHGKTTLLDKIRESNVAATEAGGITQVIRAWRVQHNGRPITFLDTPGHEAFTKMRARGAQVTDIAVIVVAADDGVMPQTEEAINHAKAAGVPVVVAINKVDVPNANLNRTRQQLYSLGLLPDNMGGDIPFVETSATKGQGIDLLLENLSILAELKELKANPNKPAYGTCLEAMLSDEEGVRATLLVRDGTLHRGDVIVCGASYGRVRVMYDDLGRPIESAGPTVPVRITGLDEVPNADDPFIVVTDLAVARSIADKRKARYQEATLIKREPVRLETLGENKIAELKVILKADFRGSIEAIRKELEKLRHAEVRVRVLHAATGGITESDVQLALTSPEDTIIVGFNVVPDGRAKALAEERGIQIREYNIIYNLTDDIKSALEGKLKPREEVVHLGRAIVRETFKISRVGTIAGCFVTEGTIERSAKVRLIRQGVVIYPPPDRTVGLESLKRFKDDVREVRQGFECGLKVAGYDDIKVDDVIEAYRVEQILRTL
ncbi:MAG TPA: translation initiation factor IF-2 [Gemmataceae bacterium]|nr:translation initiation factor IF-2 [Gemmataceae bacterium]